MVYYSNCIVCITLYDYMLYQYKSPVKIQNTYLTELHEYGHEQNKKSYIENANVTCKNDVNEALSINLVTSE